MYPLANFPDAADDARAAGSERRPQRFRHKVGALMIGGLPADYSAATHASDEGLLDEARPGTESADGGQAYDRMGGMGGQQPTADHRREQLV